MREKLLVMVALCGLVGCSTPETDESAAGNHAIPAGYVPPQDGLSDVWYQGEAEVSTYELQQNRYADEHPGEAILIFVTEDFRTDKLVKDEGNDHPDGIKVLKTNYLRRFTTGIYDYSIMTSAFTPVDRSAFPYTQKVSTSVQDWCGQMYMQVGKKRNQYRMQLHSYFESEADQTENLPLMLMEDELFNLIRLQPEQLPTGVLHILPGTAYTRLLHRPFTPMEATARLGSYTGDDFAGRELLAYTVEFEKGQRTLSIIFQQEPPYRIEGWTDTYPSGFDGKVRTTIARRESTIWSPYWQLNSAADSARRRSLHLE